VRLTRAESARERAPVGGRLAQLASSPVAVPEDERKEISVLFADIYGSLGLIANRDPELADAILSEVIDQLSDSVHRYGGTVNKIRGDGIMALFGAPVAQEDHAVRACCAAKVMCEINQERVRAVAPGFEIPIQIRVGISSGEAVVRKMTTDTSIIYDAVGEIVHLGARMEESAAPGTVRLTAATYRLVRGVTKTTPLGLQPVKGLVQPIEVYELVEVDAAASSSRWLRRQEPTRFVNRTRELAGLREALNDAAAGRGQLVALVGEAGFGKSRLLAQVLTTPRVGGFRILKGGSSSNDRLTSFLPWLRIFQSFFSIREGEDAEAVLAKTSAAIASLSADLAWAVPAVLSLLGAEPEDGPWVDLDPQVRRRQIIDAIRSVLLRASRSQPLVLILEDLHWIDAETQDAVVGQQALLPAVPSQHAADRGRSPAPAFPDRQRRPGRGAEAHADQAHGGQSLLHGGVRLRPGGRPGADRQARRLSDGGLRRHLAHPRHREGAAGRSYRSPEAGGEAHPAVGGGHRRGRLAGAVERRGRLAPRQAERRHRLAPQERVSLREGDAARCRVFLPARADP
jgi:class 3 adenylate cyclase